MPSCDGDMKIGLNIAASHPVASSERGRALAARLNADSVWVADHMLGVIHPELWPDMALGAAGGDPDAFLDPWCVLGSLAGATNVPLGMCVTDTTRRGPADVARIAITLNHMAEAGFILGVGAGEAENLVPFGYSFERPVARTATFLAELRHLIDHGTTRDGKGRLGVPVEAATGRPQVWVAGHGPKMLELTGTHGDGWLPAWAMEPVEYEARRLTVSAHAERAGRPAPVSGMYAVVLLAESRDAAAALFEAEPLAKLYALMATAEQWRKHGLAHPSGETCRGLVDLIVHDLDPAALRTLAPRVPFELVEEIVFIGSGAEIARRLAPYGAAGMEHVVLANVTGLVGGAAEARQRGRELQALVEALRHV